MCLTENFMVIKYIDRIYFVRLTEIDRVNEEANYGLRN